MQPGGELERAVLEGIKNLHGQNPDLPEEEFKAKLLEIVISDSSAAIRKITRGMETHSAVAKSFAAMVFNTWRWEIKGRLGEKQIPIPKNADRNIEYCAYSEKYLGRRLTPRWER